MSQLKSLKTIAGFRFFAYNIEDGIDKFSTFCVMTFGPVVAGSGLAEDEVIGTEDLAKGTGSDGIHGTWLQINQNGARNVFATGGFIVINVDALQLEVGSALIRTGWVDAMFIGNDFPKLQKKIEM